MKASTLLPAAVARLRTWLVAAIALSLASSTVSAAAIYSTNGGAVASDNCIGAVSCALSGGGVINAGNATNANLTDFATIYKVLGLGSSVSLRMPLGSNGQRSTGQIGDRAGVLVALDASIASVSLLGDYRLKTYLGGLEQESRSISPAILQNLQLLSAAGRPAQLEFIAGTQFDEVELIVSGTVGVLYRLNVYNAYGVPALVQQPVRGLVSRFNAADLTPFYSTAIDPINPLVSACVNANVNDPGNAVDANLDNYATFGTFLGVNCPSSLSVRLENAGGVPAGYYAGFVLGSSGLLDLNVLSRLRITTYNTVNGVRTKQESAVDPALLDLKLLPNGRYQVSFPATMEFDEVKIEQLSTVAALNNLQIYYGFGVEPSAFVGTTRILSNFQTPVPATSYATNTSGALCFGCGIDNPQGAADNIPSTKAVIRLDAGAVAQAELKLTLNGAAPNTNVGLAGYRAGMVISLNSGLLNASLLDRLTLTTYDASGAILESATGSSVLSLSLLPNGQQEISFLTTRNFASVQISAASLLALGVDINVFQAFADNLAGGLIPIITPLPVELTAFTGKWANGAAELNWATASEKNSSHFIVERSTAGDAVFQAIGRVAAAGSTSSAKTYKLRDAEAGSLGVATVYYRLRQVDLDGKEAFSPVVAVAVNRLAAAPSLEVYPNPAADSRAVMVRCPNLPATGGTVQTYSQLGQLVSEVPVAEAAARLPLPTLAPGLYYVILRDAVGQQLATRRLVVAGADN